MRLTRQQQLSALIPVDFQESKVWVTPSYEGWVDSVLSERGITPTDAQKAWQQKPTAFLSRAEFWKEILRRVTSDPETSHAYGATRKKYIVPVADQLSCSYRFLTLLEEDDHIRAAESLVQSASMLYGVKFNYLSYSGNPLTQSEDIVRDVITRSLTLGIDPRTNEFEDYFGMTFADLESQINSGESVTDELSEKLRDKFHIRILLPFKTNEVFDDASLAEFLQEFDQRMSALKMTQIEISHWMGRQLDGSWQAYRRDPILWQKWTGDLCRGCGVEWYPNGKAETIKVSIEAQYFDAELAAQIWAAINRS